MPLYEVQVARVGYGTTTIVVSAQNPAEAANAAEDEAGNHTYNEHHSEYQIGHINLAPNTPETELSAKQLADFYGTPNSWGEHPRYPRRDWQHEVGEGDTQIGYWDWVVHALEADADEEGKVTL